MSIRLAGAARFLSILLGLVTLAAVAALFAGDIVPELFPSRSHDLLAAFALGLIAVAYLVYQAALRPATAGFVKAIVVAAAFLFWAANQASTNVHRAVLFNDIAVGLFILDIFLVILGRPAEAADSSFAEIAAGGRPEERL
jgi:hypothetical protein